MMPPQELVSWEESISTGSPANEGEVSTWMDGRHQRGTGLHEGLGSTWTVMRGGVPVPDPPPCAAVRLVAALGRGFRPGHRRRADKVDGGHQGHHHDGQETVSNTHG